jgi:L-ascorbate metabolism protein UlaG (beta-lactamase superfamily)
MKFYTAFKKFMIIFFVIIVVFAFVVWLFMQQPQFGKAPEGARLERIKASPNYKDGQFHNLSYTPPFTDGATYFSVMKRFMFSRNKKGTPEDSIPSKKINLFQLHPNENILVWFGHSSYFMQIDGKKILVDPVLSGNASPLWFTTRSFPGTNVYNVDDIPPVDYLFITHDHYDHLDYKTITKLQTKVGKVITGLGVGSHLEYWGYSTEQIIEKDWNETIKLDEGFVVHTAPARHFSGRSFKRNGTLWSSFVLISPTQRIYLGGDSGYDKHFKVIGDNYGPFDLVILENGQYDDSWKLIHLNPEEVVKAAKDLKAEKLMPVHWGKFYLANHAWNESIIRVSKEANRLNQPLVHPYIGERVLLNENRPQVRWWEGLK